MLYLSALIFNAIIIPALIPVAMRGVKYKPMNAEAMLARNMLIYGVGGVIVPFIGIKINRCNNNSHIKSVKYRVGGV